MRKKNLIVIISITLIALLSVCIINIFNHKKDVSKDSLYDIYVQSNSNLKYVQIKNIKNGHIEYSKSKDISFQKKGLTMDSMCYVDNKIYCSIYKEHNGNNLSNKIAVVGNGKIKKYIKIKSEHGPTRLISDLNHKKVYSMMVIQPYEYNKNGIHFAEVNTVNDTCKKSFSIKGEINGYSIKDNYIYTAVIDGTYYGFKNLPNNYIASINVNNNQVKVLTPKGLNFSPLDIKLTPKNKFYMVSDIIPEKQISNPKLSIYNINGDFEKEIKLPPCCNSIEIDKNGLAYVNHIGKKVQDTFDGDTITVIDINTRKKIGDIDLGKCEDEGNDIYPANLVVVKNNKK
ncbi:hypothetical protein [Clostridium sp. Marseille-Q2269]|uniref:hypothetical protein n=1 Tax=Clostridium sp. Marseille-Q2269 TaxID=2942205 RepID=UPI002072E6B0|nr:hypothetical protein [Clostridium sp. Marseille-Q2269]